MENDFGAPAGPGMGGPSRANASNAVSIPAILLMVMSGLTVLWLLVGLVRPVDTAAIEEALRKAQGLTPQMENFIRSMAGSGVKLVSTLPGLILNGLIFFGALKMKNLQSYGLAMTSAILSCIPCCGPCLCLGIPVGIWALVVLNKPEVKASFT